MLLPGCQHRTGGKTKPRPPASKMSICSHRFRNPDMMQRTTSCVKAYSTLREHGHLLLDRFISMLPSALPELESQADINYLRDKLAMEIPPADAADRFKKEIDNALGTVSRQIDNMVHMSVHN